MSAESESSEPPPPAAEAAEEVMQVEERKPEEEEEEEEEGSGNFEETLEGGGGGGGGGGDGQVGCEEQVVQLGELEAATGGSEAALSEGKDQCVVSGGGGDLVGVEGNLVLEMEVEVEAEVKEQVGVSQHETLLSVTINGAEGQTQSQVQPAVCPPSLSEVSQPNTSESQTQSQVQLAVCPPSLLEVSQPNCTEGQMQSQPQSTASPNFLSELPEANCPEDRSQSQLQLLVCPTSLSELSPTSVTQPISSAPSPPLPEQRLSPAKVNNASRPVAGQQNSSTSKNLTIVPATKTPIHDGYNWRKYGQKQVKSPKGSRSYYKCTYSECCAKKIECSDHSGHVIEIVNKGTHSHDPPRKNNCTRDSRVPFPAPPISAKSVNPIGKAKESTPSTLSSNPVQEPPSTNDRKRQGSSSFNGRGEVVVKEENVVEPELKRRVKKSSLESSGALLKPGKKPKFVVHAAGDVGISGDGYRWRKYGQKMVKGNPHPRNYYRCTSAGCPVRKHIETAVDNANALIITYKGVHDHDMPVPKKRHGPPSAPLIAAAAPASMINSQPENCDTVQNQVTPTQQSAGKEGQMAGGTKDLGGKKTIESARTLLSIGFEIKPC